MVYNYLDTSDDSTSGSWITVIASGGSNGGDILSLYEDSTANTLYSFVYDEATDTWDTSATTVTIITSESSTGVENANWGAVLEPNTHNVHLVLNNDILDAGGDLESWFFFDSNRSWSRKTNVVTDIGISGDEVKPAYDYASNTLFAIYINGNDIFVKNSTDGGVTWGSAQEVTTVSRGWNVIPVGTIFGVAALYILTKPEVFPLFGEYSK